MSRMQLARSRLKTLRLPVKQTGGINDQLRQLLPEIVKHEDRPSRIFDACRRRIPCWAQAHVRGRFCEAIAHSAELGLSASDPFLLGMFSLLDAIVERPLQGILDDLNIGANIQNALVGAGCEGNSLLPLLLQVVKAYEVGN